MSANRVSPKRRTPVRSFWEQSGIVCRIQYRTSTDFDRRRSFALSFSPSCRTIIVIIIIISTTFPVKIDCRRTRVSRSVRSGRRTMHLLRTGQAKDVAAGTCATKTDADPIKFTVIWQGRFRYTHTKTNTQTHTRTLRFESNIPVDNRYGGCVSTS